MEVEPYLPRLAPLVQPRELIRARSPFVRAGRHDAPRFIRATAPVSKACRRMRPVMAALTTLRRAGLIDPIDAALDEPLVPRRFPQSTLHSSISKSLRMADALANVIAVFPVDRFRTVDCREADP